VRKTLLRIAAVAAAVLLVGGLTAYSYAAGPQKMVGVVVAEKSASFDASQPVRDGVLTVDNVLAPDDSWVVVHLDMDGKPGMRVGVAHVTAGTHASVTVRLDPGVTLTDKVLVALHADRGVRGAFEFDMKRFDSSPDKPYFVNGMELAKEVPVG
jgi:hypothetical protein